MSTESVRPETSIIIPLYNQLDYTRKCVDSILADKNRPLLELILVDNASYDGTHEYLDEVLRKHSNNPTLSWKIIRNETNLGVAPAWNQGLKAATTNELFVINNDILATNSWIQGIRTGLKKHHLAIACPYSINGPLNYELELRAGRFTARNYNRVWNDYSFCAFFMPRKTLEKIGLFDENFKVGGYEDTDYCYRLKKEGLTFGIVGSSFIHHFGSITLGEFKKTGDKHVSGNRNYFIQKWGEDPSAKEKTLLDKLFKRSHKLIRKFKMKYDWM